MSLEKHPNTHLFVIWVWLLTRDSRYDLIHSWDPYRHLYVIWVRLLTRDIKYGLNHSWHPCTYLFIIWVRRLLSDNATFPRNTFFSWRFDLVEVLINFMFFQAFYWLLAITLVAVFDEVLEFMVGVFGGKEWAASPPSNTSRKGKIELKPRFFLPLHRVI